MEMLLQSIEWTPVLVSFVLAFGLGWLWYSDLCFGKQWRAGIGISEDDNSSMAPAMIAQTVGTLLLAIVVHVAVMEMSTFYALLIGVALAVLVKANGFFSQKSKYAIMTESVYVLVMVIVMIGVHALM